MKKSLTGLLWDEKRLFKPIDNVVKRPFYRQWAFEAFQRRLERSGRRIMEPVSFNMDERIKGLDWPPFAYTMVGLKRLDNLQACIESVIQNNVPGDLIETGVWRGGSTIFMRAVLKAYDITDRRVWVADSFEGLPAPDPTNYPVDEGDIHHQFDFLRVTMEEVCANFARYDLLDDQVQFLKGWFKDILPSAPIKQLSVLRLDGDMYESTIQALTSLYPKLQPAGYIIIDDYALPGCKQAVTDFRSHNGIHEEIIDIDGTGVFWQRATN
jgi:hypothetical protein